MFPASQHVDLLLTDVEIDSGPDGIDVALLLRRVSTRLRVLLTGGKLLSPPKIAGKVI
jgi:hypothetical protein